MVQWCGDFHTPGQVLTDVSEEMVRKSGVYMKYKVNTNRRVAFDTIVPSLHFSSPKIHLVLIYTQLLFPSKCLPLPKRCSFWFNTLTSLSTF